MRYHIRPTVPPAGADNANPTAPRGAGVATRPAVAATCGFSLIEALVAIFILAVIALSLGQVVGMGMASNASADELTHATILATTKLEELRSGDYSGLVAGGDLAADAEGYVESIDANADGRADYVRRWKVTDQTGGKLIEVRTSSISRGVGPEKVATMATVVADPDDLVLS